LRPKIALENSLIISHLILQYMSIPMKYIKLSILEVTLISVFFYSGVALAWGPQGHRITAKVAENHLDPQAKRAITALLGSESLADAAFWADTMRSHPSEFWQSKAGAYHYVTVPDGMRYADVGPPQKGDAVTALGEFRRILRDPEASKAHKQLALRFSLHIVQDLHQPLHVGNGLDRGGTRTKVVLLGKNTNLHRVWDTDLILLSGRPESEWVSLLSGRLEDEGYRALADPAPETWIAESAAMRGSIYPQGQILDQDYIKAQQPALEERLLLAAARVAAYFNNLYK
jgi:hypothetical protein